MSLSTNRLPHVRPLSNEAGRASTVTCHSSLKFDQG